MMTTTLAFTLLFSDTVDPNADTAAAYQPVPVQIEACEMAGKVTTSSYMLFNGPDTAYGAKAPVVASEQFLICGAKGRWLGVVLKDGSTGWIKREVSTLVMG